MAAYFLSKHVLNTSEKFSIAQACAFKSMEAVQVVVCNASIEVVVRAAPINARRPTLYLEPRLQSPGAKVSNRRFFKASLMAMSLREARRGTLLPSENREQRMHFPTSLERALFWPARTFLKRFAA